LFWEARAAGSLDFAPAFAPLRRGEQGKTPSPPIREIRAIRGSAKKSKIPA
jgi:hypothetical protein